MCIIAINQDPKAVGTLEKSLQYLLTVSKMIE